MKNDCDKKTVPKARMTVATMTSIKVNPFLVPVLNVILAFRPVVAGRVQVIIGRAVLSGRFIIIFPAPGIERFALEIRAVPVAGGGGLAQQGIEPFFSLRETAVIQLIEL